MTDQTVKNIVANVMPVKEVVEEVKIAVKKMETSQKMKTPTEDNPNMENAKKKTDEEFRIEKLKKMIDIVTIH